MAGSRASLERKVFTLSRELEYFTADELEKQTGYPRDSWWPLVIAKELIDNGLDGAEDAGVAPEITVCLSGARLAVSDNGGGIPAEVVERLADYSTRTSDKLAYVSPTRGAQGNAWKTILAMPYVLDREQARPIVIEAQGIRHQIHVRADQIARQPAVDYRAEELTVKTGGTSVVLERAQACLEEEDEGSAFLPQLVSDFALFNPHAAFRFHDGDGETYFPARNLAWTKWSPRDPTSAHWYTPARFEELVASYVAAGHNLFIRDFVATFRGLTGTQARMQVLEAGGFPRGMKLDELADRERGTFNQSALRRLLSAMQQVSQAPPPQKLGVLGREHFLACLPGDDQSFRYHRLMGTDASGLPFVVEAASRLTEDELLQGRLHVGLNWSVPLTDPLAGCELTLPEPFEEEEEEEVTRGLEGLLRYRRIDIRRDPLALILHIASPRFEFLDRGKGSAELDPELAEAVAVAVERAIKDFAAYKTRLDREQHAAARRAEEQLRRGRIKEATVKDAAWKVLPEAYLKASGGGNLPANARQVMYAARGYILEATGRSSFDDDYFNQELLPEYQREHPEETKDWDVVYDERGHLSEPHTEVRIGIGTLAARGYLDAAKTKGGLPALELAMPDFKFRCPTHGPKHRYGAIIFIEKEGFLALFEQIKLEERYDLSIMSGKGMGSTAARQLIEHLAPMGVRIFVLHDFDKSGLSICATLSRDTTRYQFERPPEIIDLGVRLADVRQYALADEPVVYAPKSDPRDNLRENGATEEEIAFLAQRHHDGRWHGRRVELNAFTSDQLVEWLEAKLKAHKVAKVIPDARTLEQSYRRALELRYLEEHLDQAVPEARRAARARKVPANLSKRIAKMLAEDPAMSWDEALCRLTEEAD
jgi:DNA topoisomerase VI subunit B